MKILITGAGGFVAQHVVRELLSSNNHIKIDGIGRNSTSYKGFTNYYTGDLMDIKFVNQIISETKPDVIIHLASQSSVSQSWVNPNSTFTNNVNIFLNLLDTIRKISKTIRILSVGSSEEYGSSDTKILFNENSILNPTSPYAVARVAQTNLALLYAKNYGLDVVCTRSFNHYGIGQRLGFVIPDFIHKIKRYREYGDKMITGNLTVVRDFVHVNDVVDAYLKLIFNGRSGEIYNVCTGTGSTLSEVMSILLRLAGISEKLDIVNSLERPRENNFIVGDNSKIINNLGWQPKISLNDGLTELYENSNR